jgi:hypothetical protein
VDFFTLEGVVGDVMPVGIRPTEAAQREAVEQGPASLDLHLREIRHQFSAQKRCFCWQTFRRQKKRQEAKMFFVQISLKEFFFCVPELTNSWIWR